MSIRNKYQYNPKMRNLRIIAEIGQAHDGSFGLAHSYIDSLKNSGITDIKFQVHIADAESSKHENLEKNFLWLIN